mmetsp:Transcript_29584/g.52828  ORF Transcript_29584/g.52828 Transcript_29584/m.52828 type:complete len:150 (-) Transcript_29584:456-905(-)
MFSDELYKRLIEEPKPTVEDKYGVHFEYDDLYARLLQVKQSQTKSNQIPQLPNVPVNRMRRSGASTDRAGKRTISTNRLKATHTLDLKSTSPHRVKKTKSPERDLGFMYRTISYKLAPQKNQSARRSSGERISSIYGKGVKRGKKITLR